VKSSIEIHNELTAIEEKITQASDSFNAAEGDAKDAFRDSICELKGQKKALNDQLGDALSEEDSIRRGGGVPMAVEKPKPRTMNPADAFLGTPEEFKSRGGSIMDVYKKTSMKFPITDASDPTHQFYLPTPTKTSYELPSNVIEMPMSFIDTLSKGTTDSNIEYKVAGEFTNNAALWKPGQVKAESDEKWGDDSANLFTVAHHVVISRHTAYHYGQLRSLIGNDLMYGLKVRADEYALRLDDGPNKQGVLKKAGIQTYVAKNGEKFYDSARRMKTLSWMSSGFQPTYIAVHPYVSEQLDLEKSTDGYYLRLTADGKVWGIPVVEDINLFENAGTDEAPVLTYGALMYNPMSATWYTSEADALSLGFVDDQFTRNEFTLLAEGEHLITVQRPKSFVYLPDAIAAGK
jgi:HK97 family phage major capsid protein